MRGDSICRHPSAVGALLAAQRVAGSPLVPSIGCLDFKGGSSSFDIAWGSAHVRGTRACIRVAAAGELLPLAESPSLALQAVYFCVFAIVMLTSASDSPRIMMAPAAPVFVLDFAAW